MQLPKLFKPGPKERHLLVVDYDPQEVRLAYYFDSDGELIFGGNSTGPTVQEAWNSLARRPAEFSDCVLGIPYQNITDNSTVIRYRRPKPDEKITEDEIAGALDQAGADSPDEPFFEDLFSAKVDGLTTLDPVGRLGEVIELNFYQGFLSKPHLHQAMQLTHPLHLHPGIVPTSYAIAKLVVQNTKGALVLDASDHRTEAILIADSHLVGIKSFDVGAASHDIYTVALESALEDMGYDELWPEKILLIGNSQHLEALRSKLIAYPWTRNFNMLSFPEIALFRPLSVNLISQADVGINALSLLG